MNVPTSTSTSASTSASARVVRRDTSVSDVHVDHPTPTGNANVTPAVQLDSSQENAAGLSQGDPVDAAAATIVMNHYREGNLPTPVRVRTSQRRLCVFDLMIAHPSVQENNKLWAQFECKKCRKITKFQSNNGWTNPYKHLQACFQVQDLIVSYFILSTYLFQKISLII